MTYIKVRKENARKYYNKGCDIALLPCKASESVLYEQDVWVRPVIINKKNTEKTENAFDRTVNEFIYYNCQWAETGYYPHYYIKKEDMEKYSGKE